MYSLSLGLNTALHWIIAKANVKLFFDVCCQSVCECYIGFAQNPFVALPITITGNYWHQAKEKKTKKQKKKQKRSKNKKFTLKKILAFARCERALNEEDVSFKNSSEI